MSQTPLIASLFLTLMLTSCNDKIAPSSATKASTKSSTAGSVTADEWLGRWNGPEGTFIEISGGNGTYTVIIADLDGPKHYSGTSKGNHIVFEREGVVETIKASNGADTGMKWLADKSNCLRVREGEGWCRD
jgi:hypothetical protein